MTDRDRPAPISAEEPALPHSPDHETKLGMSMLMKIALAVVLVSSLIISISCLMKANQLAAQTAELESEVAAYNEKIKKLKYDINREVDDQYIIDYAREYLNMHFPDEDVYYNDVND